MARLFRCGAFLFLMLCFGVMPAGGQVNLLTAASYQVGEGPRNLASADFNGDGKADLVTANNVDATITILLNNGDGTFHTAGTYSFGTAPNDVVAGDFNGDGKTDLAVVPCGSSGANVACILLGNGDGTFHTASTYPTSATPNMLVTGDFNADGKLDLAITNSSGVDVLLGNGDGSFQSPLTLSLGTFAADLAAADFNGDGRLDLAVTNENPNKVSILLGNGDGTFHAGSAYTLSSNVLGVTVADLNLDKKPDLVIANSYASQNVEPAVSVLLGNGDGTFSSPVTYGNASQPYTAVVADFNADGKPDVALSDQVGVVHILLGNGNGTLQASVDFAAGGAPEGIVCGDFNGDGKADLATANYGSNDASVLIGNGDGTFRASRSYSLGNLPAPLGSVSTSLALADFNEDGKLDFATGLNNTLALGNGDGTFTLGNFVGNAGFGIISGDFNHDGHADIAAVTNLNLSLGNTAAAVLLGNGNGTFQAERDSSSWALGLEYIATGDFNGDGNLDLVETAPNSAAMGLGDGTGNFTYSQPAGAPRGLQSVVGDLNGDGRDDIIVPQNQTVTVALGNADGTLTSTVLPYPFTNIVNVAIGDLNADGKLDLVGVDNVSSGADVVVLLGNGDGTFQAPVSYSVDPNPTAVAIADMNQDGRPDLVVAFATSVEILLGNGDGTFQSPVRFGSISSGSGPFAIATGDLNGDGLPDVMVERAIGVATASVEVLLNETGIVPAQANVALVSALNPAASGQAVQLTATVTPVSGSGVPTGTITFLNGSTSLGSATLSSGSASISTSTLPVGNNSLTASYSGDRFFAGASSTALVQVVNANPFTVAPTTSSSATVTAGQAATFPLTLTPGTAQSQTVTLTCGTPPPNATCTISPDSVTLSGTATGSAMVTIQTAGAASAFILAGRFGPSTPASFRWELITLAGIISLGVGLFGARRRRLAFGLVFACLFLLPSCGGNSTSGGDHGTPAGTYTVPINAQANGSTQTINLAVTVQ